MQGYKVLQQALLIDVAGKKEKVGFVSRSSKQQGVLYLVELFSCTVHVG